MKKIGVFVARMQPVHNAHIEIIKKMYEENDAVYVFICSADKKFTERNPFDITIRHDLLINALEENDLNDDYINIVELNDWSFETDYENQKEWGRYLYYNIVSKINQKEFSIYYSDNPQIMLDWFDEDIKNRINFRFLNREEILEGVSATKVREAIYNEDYEYLNKYCPKCVCKKNNVLKLILDIILELMKKK